MMVSLPHDARRPGRTRGVRVLSATLVFTAGLGFAAAPGCGSENETPGVEAGQTPVVLPGPPHPLDSVTQAVALLKSVFNSRDAVEGSVYLEQQGDVVFLTATLDNLQPGVRYGLAVHQYGDIEFRADGSGFPQLGARLDVAGSLGDDVAGDGASAGEDAGTGSGDDEVAASAIPGLLGVIEAEADGRTLFLRELDTVSVAGDRRPLLGRGLVVYRLPDDPEAGVARLTPLAGGVIGRARPRVVDGAS